MKTISRIFAISGLAALMLVGCATRATLVVRERPVEPVYVRPVAPGPNAVWIPGEWEWRGGRYVFIQGHYVVNETRVWIPGHWRETPDGGFIWVRGHWR